MKQFKHLVFAGTFDYLHIGHKRLLDRAFELAEKVSIGITTEKLYKSKPLANLIQTWQVRRRAVTEYLRERNWLKRARFFRLDDIYGPAIVDRTMDSILVTKLTKPNTELINKIRKKKGLPLLRIIVAPLVRGDDEEIVTSERIRMGEIDREGHNFQFLISNFQKKSLILPKYLRKELRKPLGILIKSQIPITNNQSNPKSQLPNNKTLIATSKKTLHFINRLMPTMVITVGDIITESLLRINIEPEVKLID
ncbi:pantetheine-phosphate adenylyltransferase, partial [Candidatus Roizmanbacteria bacterium]|nr:pantetheine-phosphate adenylyltransferase [Candidatus Roizmanbacteria bacterium]